MKTNFPTQKGVAFVIRHPKGRDAGVYTRAKVGAMLLPNGFHAKKCEDTVRRRFPDANAFRVYDAEGAVYFAGSL